MINEFNDPMEQWDLTQKALLKLRNELVAKQGARDQLLKVQKKEEKSLVELKEKHRLAHLAQLFILSEIADRRQSAIESIEKMATFALRLVYGRGYKLKFNTFDEKRKEGATNFKMEINIASPSEYGELITGLIGERGGGVVEIVAFALRIAALSWAHYDGPLILDEAYKSMSNDEKLHAVARFLREVTDQTGRQIIFATHRAEIFGQVADKVIEVTNNNGTSITLSKEPAQIVDEVDEELWD